MKPLENTDSVKWLADSYRMGVDGQDCELASKHSAIIAIRE